MWEIDWSEKVNREYLGLDSPTGQRAGAHYFEDDPTYRDKVADMIADWISTKT